MSGNTMFWQVRLEDAGRAMVCHKYTAHEVDPVVGTDAQATMTGMWADPLVGRPETALLGAGSAYGLYSRFGAAMPRGSGAFTVYRYDHWMFDGTGLRYGDLLGVDDGVVGYETVGCRLGFDAYQLPIAAGGDGTPAEVEVVAFTPSSNLAMGEYPASIAALDDQGDLEFVASRLSRPRRRRDAGAVPLRQRCDADVPPVRRRRRRGRHDRLDRLGVRARRRSAGRPGHAQRDRQGLRTRWGDRRCLIVSTVVRLPAALRFDSRATTRAIRSSSNWKTEGSTSRQPSASSTRSSKASPTRS